MSGHVVLIGDSIFDNRVYVPGGPAVIDHLHRALPEGWKGTLLAVDGSTVAGVPRQLERLPGDATHLVLSVGGNDALWTAGSVFAAPAANVREALDLLAEPWAEFESAYRILVRTILGRSLPLAVCTIYDSVPGLTPAERIGLSVFNDVITRVAFEVGATLIDLRLLCREASDYSSISQIEPSAAGGGKIARAIVRALFDGEQGCRVVI